MHPAATTTAPPAARAQERPPGGALTLTDHRAPPLSSGARGSDRLRDHGARSSTTTRQDRFPAARIGRDVVVARRLFGLLRSDDGAAGARASPRGARGPRPPGRRRPRIRRPRRRRGGHRQDRPAARRSSSGARRAAAVGHVRLAEHAPPARPAARRRGRAGPVGRRTAARHRGPARDLRRGARRPARPPARVRRRGPALGRRGDARPRALPRPPDRDAAAAAGAVVPRRARRRPSAEPGARRPGRLAGRAPAAADPAEPVGRRRRSLDGHAARPGRRPPPHRGQPVLRQPDPRPAGRRRCPRASATPCSPGPPGWPRRRGGSLELLSCTPEPRRRRAARRARRVDGDGRGARRHRSARPARPRRRVPPRDRPVRGPRRGRARLRAGAARGDDRRARVGRRRTRACSPTTRRRAGDVARILRYAPAAAAEASRSGAHREAVAFYETALRHVGDDTATRADLLEALSVDLYLTDRLRDAIAARERALELRRGPGRRRRGRRRRTPRSPASPGTRPTVRSAERHARAAIEILSAHRRPRGRWASPWPGTPSSRRSAATPRRRDGRATARARIADELGGDAVLRGTASIGVAVARLLDGDLGGRADLLAATDVGLRHRLDDLATTPMSNLCHYDVEQGRFAEAEESVAEALRISEERDTPICTRVPARGAGAAAAAAGPLAEAEDDARAVLAVRRRPPGPAVAPSRARDARGPAGRARRRTRTWTSCGGW